MYRNKFDLILVLVLTTIRADDKLNLMQYISAVQYTLSTVIIYLLY